MTVFSAREMPLIEGEQLDFELSLDHINDTSPASDSPSVSDDEDKYTEDPSEVIISDEEPLSLGKRVRKPSAKLHKIRENRAITGNELDKPESVITANLVHAMFDVASMDPCTLAEAMKSSSGYWDKVLIALMSSICGGC
ncbi:hypothetical protein BDW22DRAFT_1431249 [Trametopsis cervina]|nr:hypothetical protein BDW22DRAFT_1431249 [Trametopsis cervina]